MPHQVDITIVGAGVIGLAIASQVANGSRDVYVLEKNGIFGQEASGRNSEVIHAGIYYPRDSLKAKMCLEGNALLYKLCRKHGIGHRELGKIMVATDDDEAEELEKLYERGRDNGVALEMLSQRQMRQLEPNMRGKGVLLSSLRLQASWIHKL
jgi:Predicted dehydrogenase